ncbi:MAG: DOMON domain-containing protein [Desulfotalea sp.]
MAARYFLRSLALLSTLLLVLTTQALANEYQHSVTTEDMTFSWSIDGDNLAAKVSGPTTGWVSVGFNPTKNMKDANIIIGYVKKGKVKIIDEYGIAATQHKSDKKVGGTDNVTVVGGSEEGNVTTIEFIIPLKSGDEKDSALDPAVDTAVILAYGPDRDSFRLKHEMAYKVTVNLGNGAIK